MCDAERSEILAQHQAGLKETGIDLTTTSDWPADTVDLISSLESDCSEDNASSPEPGVE